MTLIKELQIKITMSNYNQRSSSYSSNYDYLFLDNLLDSVLNISLKKIQSKQITIRYNLTISIFIFKMNTIKYSVVKIAF